MPARPANDAAPPPHWPEKVVYLTKPRLSSTFPAQFIPLLYDPSAPQTKFTPRPTPHPNHVTIKPISMSGHPANGQNGLFAKRKIQPGELIIPYLGVIHHTLIPLEPSAEQEEHESDYDLSLLRLSHADPRNPFQGNHISIGVDAAEMGNAARFVNDFRGIGGAPNAEFKLGRGEGGELIMEIWALKGKGCTGIGKGDEVLVSYGKSWWGARKGTES
jgi:SET domain-containing protein